MVVFLVVLFPFWLPLVGRGSIEIYSWFLGWPSVGGELPCFPLGELFPVFVWKGLCLLGVHSLF